MSRPTIMKVVLDAFLLAGISTSVWYLTSLLADQVSNGNAPFQSESNKKRAKTSLSRLKRENPDIPLECDHYENIVLSNVIGPDDINVSFKDIGGLDDVIDELQESVLYPLTQPQLFARHSSLLKAPKGVLLFGPPGCGKTMMAKALACQSGANFINVKISTIMDKFYGESNKIVAAIFSLAAKLEPCIIFIDEIDSFLRERSSSDHEMTAMLKAEFMTLWDGLTSSDRVIVLGATNRMSDIDSAILRRMPKRFSVGLPKAPERRRILELVLKDTDLEDGFPWDLLVTYTSGLSGSDLQELCRNAAMRAMREHIKLHFKNGQRTTEEDVIMRPLNISDFLSDKSRSESLLPEQVRQLGELAQAQVD